MNNTMTEHDNTSSQFLLANSWGRYLAYLALLLGAGLFASGVVTWIAANWAGFSQFQKLYGTQTILALSLLSSLLLFWYQRQRKRDKGFPLSSSTAAFVGAVLIGALFALIGQIYQTGADAWELFAYWSLFQIPLLLALPNMVAFTLLLVTSNVAFMLYGSEERPAFLFHLLAIAVNIGYLMVSEFALKRLHDGSWRISPRVASLVLSVSVIWAIINAVQLGSRYDETADFTYLACVLGIGIGVLGMFVYYRWRSDMIVYGINMLLAITAMVILVLYINDFSYNVLFILSSMVVVAAVTAIAMAMNKTKQRMEQEEWTEVPWVLQAFFMVAILPALLLFFGGFFLLGIDISPVGLGTCLLMLGGAIIFRHRFQDRTTEAQECRPKPLSMRSLMRDLVGQAFIGLGLMLFFVYWVVDFSASYLGANSDTPYSVIAFMVLAFVTFILVPVSWIRLGAIILISLAFFTVFLPAFYANELGSQILNRGDDSGWLLVSQAWLFLIPICFGLAYYYHKLSMRLTIVFWALCLYVLGAFFFFKGQTLTQAVGWGSELVDPALAQTSGWAIVTGYFFQEWSWFLLPHYLLLFAPALISFAVGKILPLAARLLTTGVVFLVSLLWISTPSVLFALSLLLLAYQMRNLTLFFLAASSTIAFLGMYYFSLHIPLLYKSYLLLGLGLAFLLIVILAYCWSERSARKQGVASREEAPTPTRQGWVLVLLSTTLVAVLGVTNQKIWQYESVLDQGRSVILELEPVDPRSLMQGDYMKLNYEIIRFIKGAYQMSGSSYQGTKSSAYALLKNDAQGVARFCAISEKLPTEARDFGQCDQGLFIPFKVGKPRSRIKLPSHGYFFAEGAGLYYAQARYGEFKVSRDGTALLSKLLDINRQPLLTPEPVQTEGGISAPDPLPAPPATE